MDSARSMKPIHLRLALGFLTWTKCTLLIVLGVVHPIGLFFSLPPGLMNKKNLRLNLWSLFLVRPPKCHWNNLSKFSQSLLTKFRHPLSVPLGTTPWLLHGLTRAFPSSLLPRRVAPRVPLPLASSQGGLPLVPPFHSQLRHHKPSFLPHQG